MFPAVLRTLVGWGSSKRVMSDAVHENEFCEEVDDKYSVYHG